MNTMNRRSLLLAGAALAGLSAITPALADADMAELLKPPALGDMALGELRGPMREETVDWINRVSLGLKTQHATAAEGHNRLMLTKAIDLSARLRKPIPLPISAADIAS